MNSTSPQLLPGVAKYSFMCVHPCRTRISRFELFALRARSVVSSPSSLSFASLLILRSVVEVRLGVRRVVVNVLLVPRKQTCAGQDCRCFE